MTDASPRSLDAADLVLGSLTDTSSNTADTSTAMNLLRHIDSTVSGTSSNISFTQSEGGSVVDTSATSLEYYALYLYDRTAGAIASASIDISTATISLAKSTGGGAFSTAGITQPTLAKANGVVSTTVTFNSAQWAIGDAYRLLIDGVKATDSASTVETIPQMAWIGQIDTDSTVASNVSTVKTAQGTNADAATDPSLASGTLFSKLRGVGNDTDTIIAATDTLETNIGANTDASTDPSAASGTLFSKIRGAGDNLDTIIAATDTLEGSLGVATDAAATVVNTTNTLQQNAKGALTTVGFQTDSAVYAKGTTSSEMSYIKALLDVGILRQSTAQAGTTSTLINDNTLPATTNYYRFMALTFLTGTCAGVTRTISTMVASTSLTVSSGFPATPAAGDVYVIASIVADTNMMPSADSTTANFARDAIGAKTDTRFYETAQTDLTTRSIINIQKGIASSLNAWQGASTSNGAADGSTIVDTTLTATNYAGQTVVMVSGTAGNLGVCRLITTVSGTTLTVAPPFPAQTVTADKYVILTTAFAKNLQTTNAGTNLVASGGPVENTIIDSATPLGGQIQVYMDLNALTQNATIKLYRKIDGTNYRVMKTYALFTAGTSDVGFYTDPFYTRNGFKLTITPSVAEGAARSIPYEILGVPGA